MIVIISVNQRSFEQKKMKFEESIAKVIKTNIKLLNLMIKDSKTFFAIFSTKCKKEIDEMLINVWKQQALRN